MLLQATWVVSHMRGSSQKFGGFWRGIICKSSCSTSATVCDCGVFDKNSNDRRDCDRGAAMRTAAREAYIHGFPYGHLNGMHPPCTSTEYKRLRLFSMKCLIQGTHTHTHNDRIQGTGYGG